MKNNAKLMELEARIEVLEKELRNLKEEVEALKAAEITEAIEATDTTATECVDTVEAETNVKEEDIFVVPIEDLDLSARAFNRLKRAGIHTLGGLAVMTEEDLYDVLKHDIHELISKFGHFPLKAELVQKYMIEAKKAEEARKVKEEQDRQLALRLSKNFLVALEVYAKFEEQAANEGITWHHLLGLFHLKFQKLRYLKSYTIAKDTLDGKPILNSNYCLECINGKHPRMLELLTADEDKITIDMIKEAILEDFREENKSLGKNTKSYKYALRFIEIVKAYEE